MKMKNKTLIAGVVLILVLVFGLIGWKYLKQPTQEIPPEFREKYNQLNQWLDKKLIEWKPEKYQPMSFCAHHIIASERMLIKDESLDLPFLEMLKETGVDCIRLSIYPYNYEKYTQRYNNLITKIKENNLTLMVAYFVGDLSKGRISSFEEYKQLEINFTKNFIEKHKPDYYAIVTEPITMEKRIKLDQRVKDEEWIGLVEEINKIVKEISPETKTMAAVNDEPGQAELAIRFAQIRDLDVVAFQFYNPFSFQRLEKAVKFAKEQGKETWITETWLGSGGKVETFEGLKIVNPYFNYPFMESLHAKWIKVAVYYAQNHNIDGFTPFFTNLFVHYPATDNLKEAIERSVEAFKAGERTKVFYAYKEVIEEVGKIWSSDDYMNYYIEHYINKQLPQLTKEQINSIINNKSEKLTKKIKDIQDFYTKKQNKVSTSELTSDEKKKALGIIDKILN